MIQHNHYWYKELESVNMLSNLKEQKYTHQAAPVHPLITLDVPGELLARMDDIVKKSDFGLYVFFLAALHLLTRWYQPDETVTTMAPGFLKENDSAADNAPIFFVSVPDNNASIRAFLNFIREKVKNAHGHQQYDVALLKKQMKHNGLFTIAEHEGIWISYNKIQSCNNAPASLNIVMERAENQLALKFEFASGFTDGFPEQFSTNFLSLLPLMLEDMDISVKTLSFKFNKSQSVLPAAEKYTLQETTIADLFKKNAAAFPGHPAVYYQGRLASQTYRELDSKSDTVAHYLLTQAGVKQGAVVAVCADTSPDYLSCCLGIIKIGGVVLSIEKKQPSERISFMLRDSQCSLLVCSDPTERYNLHTITLQELFSGNVAGQKDFLETAVTIHPEDPVFLIYTSGSTGQPKGVILNHMNMVNQYTWFKDYFNFKPTDVLPQKASLNFVDSLTELYLPLTVCPGAVYLRPYDDINRDSAALFKWFSDIEVTIALYVPSLFEYAIASEKVENLSTLKHLVLGGEEMKRHYDYDFNVYNLYGNSECSSISSIFHMQNRHRFYKIPIGKPIHNTTIYILDEQMNPLPYFMQGEIFIGGQGVGPGYINNPEMTAAKFIPNPFLKGSYLYRTGDFGRIYPDGNIEYIGRKDRQVKIRGIRIDLEEIENKIRAVVDIGDVAVLYMGESHTKFLAAACVFKPHTAALNEVYIKEQLVKVLPSYMIPSRWIFPGEMPLTASGKISRTALTEKFSDSNVPAEKPNNEIEEQVLAIWKTVLNKSQLSITDNFFTCGGQSLNMIYVLHQVKEKFNITVDLNDFIVDPTIRGLSLNIHKRLQMEANEAGQNIVLLNKFAKEQPNLMMLHPFDGLAVYHNLATQLEGYANVYGFNAMGILNDSVMLPGTYEELAHAYLQEIVKLGLTGELILCGYSASVPLAFEIAKHIQEGAFKLTKVLLVDDYFRAATRCISKAEQEILFHAELRGAVRRYLNIGAKQVEAGSLFNITEVYDEYLANQQDNVSITQAQLEKYVSVISALFWLQMSHQPSGSVPVDCVYLFSEKYGADSSWRPYFSQNFHFKQLQGTHAQLFHDVNIAQNALLIRESISQGGIIPKD